MQNRINYSDADHNDTSITVHLQNSSHLVLFLIKNEFLAPNDKLSTYYFCIAVFLWHGKYRLCQVFLCHCFLLI